MKLKKIFLGLLFIFSFTVITGCGLFNKKTTTIPFEERFNSLYPKILQIFDEDYEPDMEISDFIDEDLYEQYLNICKFSTTYTQIMIEFNISEDNAVDALTDFANLGQNETVYFITIVDYVKTLDKYGITPHILTNLIVELSMTFVDIALENAKDNQLKYQKEIDELIKQNNELLEGQIFTNISNKFYQYSNEWDYEIIFQTINSSDFYQYNLYSVIQIMAKDLINFGYINSNADYYYYGTYEVYNAFENALINAHLNNDIQFLETLIDHIYILEQISMNYRDIEDLSSIPFTDESSIYALEQIQAIYNQEKDALITSIEAVLTYLINVSNVLDVNHIKQLLQSDEITEQELFVIKDEIVATLRETLPSINDLEKMLLLSKVIFNFFIGENIEISLNDNYINKIATLNHYSYKLLIEFIDALNYEVYEDIKNIIDDGISEYCYYDYYWEEYICEVEEVEMETVVALILYIDDFYNTFKDNNSASFEAIKAIYEDDELKQIHENIVKKGFEFIAVNFLEFPEEQLEELREVIDDMFEVAKLAEQAQEIIRELGLDVYEKFIDSKGEILLNYEKLYKAIDNEAPINDINSALDSLLVNIIEYYDITLSNLTKTEIKTIVKEYVNQIKYDFTMDVDELDMANKYIDALSDSITQIIYDLIHVEKAFIVKLYERGFNLTKFEGIPELDIEDSLNQHIIIALNYVLDDYTKDKIIINVENYFDLLADIAYEFDYYPYYDIYSQKYSVINRIFYVFESIEVIAEYDFNNLDSEQLAFYQEFIDTVFTDPYDYY